MKRCEACGGKIYEPGDYGITYYCMCDQEDETVTKIYLSEEDYDAFIEGLNNPSEPNEALKEAFKKYKEMKDKSQIK